LWTGFNYTPESPPPGFVCVVKKITGHECPACGITRALTALAHARFVDAYHYFPFVYPACIGLLIAMAGAVLPDRLWKIAMANRWVCRILILGGITTVSGILLRWILRWRFQ